MDLHKAKRGVLPGPITAKMWLDGHPYTIRIRIRDRRRRTASTDNARGRCLAKCAATYCTNRQQLVAESGPSPSTGVASWRSEATVPTLD